MRKVASALVVNPDFDIDKVIRAVYQKYVYMRAFYKVRPNLHGKNNEFTFYMGNSIFSDSFRNALSGYDFKFMYISFKIDEFPNLEAAAANIGDFYVDNENSVVFKRKPNIKIKITDKAEREFMGSYFKFKEVLSHEITHLIQRLGTYLLNKSFGTLFRREIRLTNDIAISTSHGEIKFSDGTPKEKKKEVIELISRDKVLSEDSLPRSPKLHHSVTPIEFYAKISQDKDLIVKHIKDLKDSFDLNKSMSDGLINILEKCKEKLSNQYFMTDYEFDFDMKSECEKLIGLIRSGRMNSGITTVSIFMGVICLGYQGDYKIIRDFKVADSIFKIRESSLNIRHLSDKEVESIRSALQMIISISSKKAKKILNSYIYEAVPIIIQEKKSDSFGGRDVSSRLNSYKQEDVISLERSNPNEKLEAMADELEAEILDFDLQNIENVVSSSYDVFEKIVEKYEKDAYSAYRKDDSVFNLVGSYAAMRFEDFFELEQDLEGEIKKQDIDVNRATRIMSSINEEIKRIRKRVDGHYNIMDLTYPDGKGPRNFIYTINMIAAGAMIRFLTRLRRSVGKKLSQWKKSSP